MEVQRPPPPEGKTVTRLLHISSSPRGAASESLAIAGAFLDSYRDTHPGHDVDTFDLWDGSLPDLGPAAAAAKMAVFAGEVPQPGMVFSFDPEAGWFATAAGIRRVQCRRHHRHTRGGWKTRARISDGTVRRTRWPPRTCC